MSRRILFAALGALTLSACDEAAGPSMVQAASAPPRTTFDGPASTAEFATVMRRVEPVAERECRTRTRGMNCDFNILIDSRADLPANAYQTVDSKGRPQIVFTQALIRQARNGDELAFVMAHEAAHHIAGHLTRTQTNAVVGALILTSITAMSGGSAEAVQAATDLGAQLGARSFSKDFELEADALGTVIAHNSGFDPVRGAVFFQRIPDPGDQFLGTHPPNAQRIQIVQRVAGGL